MPRKYIKKLQKKYSEKDLEAAKEMLLSGTSIYLTAKTFNIPFETLRRNATIGSLRFGSGRITELSCEEEKNIVEVLSFSAKCGFPFDNKDLQIFIKSYLDAKGRENGRFKDNLPGKDWLMSFGNRWKKELGKRKPELLTKARAEGLSAEVLDLFFEKYQQILEDNDLVNKPEQIFNLDESGLSTDPRNRKIIVPKKSKSSYMLSASCGKAMYTVLFCCSATGEFLPVFIVYKGLHLYGNWTTGGPQGALYGCSPSGWMMDNIFESWLQAFAKYVEHRDKPILLLMDGHGSHLTYQSAKICKENQIILFAIPPNTSHALQPLDVGVFSPMKKIWKDVLHKWSRESRLNKIDKAVFPSLVKQLVSKVDPQWAVGGFKGSGLVPLDKEVVRNRVISVTTEEHLDENVTALREAIINTLSPEPTQETIAALENSKKRRQRVQSKVGEVLTSAEAMARLAEEEENRNDKKIARKSAAIKKTANKSAAVKQTANKSAKQPAEAKKTAGKSAKQPGCSYKLTEKDLIYLTAESDEEDDDESDNGADPCIICQNSRAPREKSNCVSIIIWVKCDVCSMWAHNCCLPGKPMSAPRTWVCSCCLKDN